MAEEPQNIEVACSNCDWTGAAEDTVEIQDFWIRVSAGETMPYGECPECGCLCHAKSSKPSYKDLVDLLAENLEAWDGEEDSVKVEHGELITKISKVLDEVEKAAANG